MIVITVMMVSRICNEQNDDNLVDKCPQLERFIVISRAFCCPHEFVSTELGIDYGKSNIAHYGLVIGLNCWLVYNSLSGPYREV